MSPLDMLIFLFFILVTIKAAIACRDHWRDIDEEAERLASRRVRPSAHLVRTANAVRTVKPSSVRITAEHNSNSYVSPALIVVSDKLI